MSGVPVAPARAAARADAGARRRRVAARTRLDFWFDAVLLLGFTLAYSYSFTGIGIHEWLGIGFGVALVLHLTLPPGAQFVLRPGSRAGRPGAVRVVEDGGMDLGLASMLDPANLPDLRHTVVIEAAVAAGVVILNAGYRRWRRARRRSAPYRRGI